MENNLKKLTFNPGRFADALAKNLFARGFGKAIKLRRERRRRARLLRKGKTRGIWHSPIASIGAGRKPAAGQAPARNAPLPPSGYTAGFFVSSWARTAGREPSPR